MKETDLPSAAPRPDGVPGLLIDEIKLTGIYITPSRGYMAQVRDPSGLPYLLRGGDELYDGRVKTIRKSEVVFMQVVADPTAGKPFREVVKRLKPA